jgi:lipopolysaccharide/colanic/teichoic acid biosynthesis glycosyltransferase
MEVLVRLRRMHAIPMFDASILCGFPFAAAIFTGVPAHYFSPWSSFFTFVAVFGGLTLLLLHLCGAHKIFFQHFGGSDVMNILRAVGLGFSAAFVAAYLVGGTDEILQRAFITALVATTTILLLSRYAARTLRRAFSGHWTRRQAVKNILVVGANPLAAAYVTASRDLPASSTRIVGVIADDPRHAGRVLRGIRILGTATEFPSVIDKLRNHGVEVSRVVMTVLPSSFKAEVRSEFERCIEANGIAIETLTNSLGFSEATSAPSPDPIGVSIGSYRGKRLLDIAVASLGLLLCTPLIALAVLLVLLDLGWPIIFWQERPGRFGVPFRLYKLRTMKSPIAPSGTISSSAGSVTPLGYLLQKSRIDELPQLLNVLAGTMSLVGPRPLLPRDQPPSCERRLVLRPGLTGWAQVNGGKFLTPEQKLELDLWYAENCSLALDLRILWRTFATILHGDLDRPLAFKRTSPQRESQEAKQHSSIGHEPLASRQR